MVSKKVTKKGKKKNGINNVLTFIGLVALGLFILSISVMLWGFISDNAIIILTVSGFIIVIFLITGILSKKNVKKAFKSLISNYTA